MVLEAPRRFAEARFPLPAIGDDEFLLRVEMVTICGGDPIEYEGRNRRAHYPLVLGHEVTGTIEQIGNAAAARHGVEAGARVIVEPYISCLECPYCLAGNYHFCDQAMVYGVTISSDRPPHLWGAYGEYLYGAPGAHVHRMAGDVPSQAACLTSVVANAVRWIHTRGMATAHEPVLILGGGVQALASVIVAREAGLGPIVVVARARNPRKMELARAYGADAIIDAESDKVVEQIQGVVDAGSLRLAVECTGAQSMIDLGVEALDVGGRLVQAGTRGGESAAVDIDAVVFKELDLRGGLGQAGDTEQAAGIVNSRRYPIEEMVTHVFPLSQVEDAMRTFMEGRNDVIHIALDPAG
jgi:threonine dehydrogenase-like Zn-dependent dehydrogenase